jgi:hypothetical protein
MAMNDDFVSVCEESRRVKMNKRKAQLIVAARLVESRRIGNTNVIKRGSLDAFVADGRRKRKGQG